MFQNLWDFMEVLKLMVFYRDSETHGILRRFLNPWYLTEVLKDFSWGLKKVGEHLPQGWLGNYNLG